MKLPPIGSTVRMEDGTLGEVYRHEYDDLSGELVHVMTLEGDQYGECLTCHKDELTQMPTG